MVRTIVTNGTHPSRATSLDTVISQVASNGSAIQQQSSSSMPPPPPPPPQKQQGTSSSSSSTSSSGAATKFQASRKPTVRAPTKDIKRCQKAIQPRKTTTNIVALKKKNHIFRPPKVFGAYAFFYLQDEVRFIFEDTVRIIHCRGAKKWTNADEAQLSVCDISAKDTIRLNNLLATLQDSFKIMMLPPVEFASLLSAPPYNNMFVKAKKSDTDFFHPNAKTRLRIPQDFPWVSTCRLAIAFTALRCKKEELTRSDDECATLNYSVRAQQIMLVKNEEFTNESNAAKAPSSCLFDPAVDSDATAADGSGGKDEGEEEADSVSDDDDDDIDVETDDDDDDDVELMEG